MLRVFPDMGVGVSTMENSPLISLCEERKELIKAAVDTRYYLATVHVLYFQSLLDFGNSLNQFVEEELVVIPDSDDDECYTEDNIDSSTDCCHHGSECSNTHNSCCREISKQNSQCTSSSSRYEQPGFKPVTKNGFDLQYPHSPDPDNSNSVPSCAHACTSSNDVRYHKNKEGFNDDNSNQNPKNYSSFGDRESFNVPVEMPNSFEFFSDERNVPNSPSLPTPEPPSASAWDFLDPFNWNDYAYFDYYDPERDELEENRLREVREKEVIPDLEDETNQSSDKGKSSETSKQRKERKRGSFSKESTPKTNEILQSFDIKEKEIETVSHEESVPGGSETQTLLTSLKDEDSGLKESESLETGHVFTENEDSSSSIGLALSIQKSGSKDLRIIVKEIKNLFEMAFDNGKEVSALLEAGRLPYQSATARFKELASRIFGSGRYSHMPLSCSNTKLKAMEGICEEDIHKNYSCLSSTLDRLYVWEKKLHDEVRIYGEIGCKNPLMREQNSNFVRKNDKPKNPSLLCFFVDQIKVLKGGIGARKPRRSLKAMNQILVEEEKLRVIYDKEWKILKNLDDRGAETSKIETAQTSVKRVLSKISIAVKAIDSVSRRVHKLRDEELQSQLFELIQGLMKMWKNLAKCHNMQFRIITGSKSCVHIIDPVLGKKSRLKATQKLEAEILKHNASFTNYVTAQRSFAKLLNDWFSRCISHNPEEIENDETAPQTPGLFRVCHDWYNAIEAVTETKVTKAIQDLASRFRVLQEMQVKEEQLRIRAQQISKEIDKQMRNFQENWTKNGPSNDSENDEIALVGGVNEELASMRKTLNEQTAKHEEVVKDLNDTVSASMQEGLLPVFEAMENFCLENLKAYNKLRIPRRDQSN